MDAKCIFNMNCNNRNKASNEALNDAISEALNDAESGERKPSMDVVKALAKALDVKKSI